MRSQEEIVQRIRERMESDLLDFEWPEYLGALSADSAEALRGVAIKDDADLSGWAHDWRTDQDVIDVMIEYMPFAFEKATNQRGISAGRSISHYVAWLWLVGVEWCEEIEDYDNYGLPQLRRICQFLDIDPSQFNEE